MKCNVIAPHLPWTPYPPPHPPIYLPYTYPIPPIPKKISFFRKPLDFSKIFI